jgi:hypothetical protein
MKWNYIKLERRRGEEKNLIKKSWAQLTRLTVLARVPCLGLQVKSNSCWGIEMSYISLAKEAEEVTLSHRGIIWGVAGQEVWRGAAFHLTIQHQACNLTWGNAKALIRLNKRLLGQEGGEINFSLGTGLLGLILVWEEEKEEETGLLK